MLKKISLTCVLIIANMLIGGVSSALDLYEVEVDSSTWGGTIIYRGNTLSDYAGEIASAHDMFRVRDFGAGVIAGLCRETTNPLTKTDVTGMAYLSYLSDSRFDIAGDVKRYENETFGDYLEGVISRVDIYKGAPDFSEAVSSDLYSCDYSKTLHAADGDRKVDCDPAVETCDYFSCSLDGSLKGETVRFTAVKVSGCNKVYALPSVDIILDCDSFEGCSYVIADPDPCEIEGANCSGESGEDDGGEFEGGDFSDPPTDGGEIVPDSGTNLTDTDADGILDVNDNCASVKNADQTDINKDGIGDACQDSAAVYNTGSCSLAGMSLSGSEFCLGPLMFAMIWIVARRRTD